MFSLHAFKLNLGARQYHVVGLLIIRLHPCKWKQKPSRVQLLAIASRLTYYLLFNPGSWYQVLLNFKITIYFTKKTWKTNSVTYVIVLKAFFDWWQIAKSQLTRIKVLPCCRLSMHRREVQIKSNIFSLYLKGHIDSYI